MDDEEEGTGNALIVDSRDLEGAIEGTESIAMDIDEVYPEPEPKPGTSRLTLFQQATSSLEDEEEEEDDYDLQEDEDEDEEEEEDDEDDDDDDMESAIKTRNRDIRTVTSQYLQGDLSCTEYATAIEGLVDVDDNDLEDESEEEEDEDVTKEKSDQGPSTSRHFANVGESKTEVSLCPEPNEAEGVGDGASSPLQNINIRRNSKEGFYGSGATPTTFKVFRKQRLSTTLQRLIGAAHVRFAQGDYNSAIDMCLEIIKEQPTCLEPFQTLSMIYENQGRLGKSLQFALIAGLLSPKSCTDWPKMAEMSFEQHNYPQAIMCYAQAIKQEPRNPDYYKRRCELLDSYGDTKGSLKAYAQILILFPEQGPLCIDVLRKMARIYYDNGDICKAHETLNVAFNDHFKAHVTTEEINLMLELCLALRKYVEAFEIILDHAGVKLIPPVEPLSFQSRATLTQALRSTGINCEVPDAMNIDILAKLIGILIHLEAFHLSEKFVSILKSSDADTFGDLYLDVAEAYMSKQNYAIALTVLVPLIDSEKYNVAAVWLRFAECLFLLQRLEEAAEAYEKVVLMAPNHTLAKLNLSIILQRLGRAEDALETLAPPEKQLKEVEPLDASLLVERCNILLKGRRISEFIQTARLMLSRHCPTIRNIGEAQVVVMATNKTRTRMEALQFERRIHGQPIEDPVPEFVLKECNIQAEWHIYLKLCQILLELERFDILSRVVYSASASYLFSTNPRMEKTCEMQCYYSSLMTAHPVLLPLHIRFLLSNFPKNPCVLNMFSMALQRCESDTRFGRHILRLLSKRPNDKRLMLLNAHISFATGTYKNSLMEYLTLYAENPKNPILPLMISAVLLHILTQKTSTSRNSVVMNVIVYMKKYMEGRGECQEAYYNLGRAYHFLGFLQLATQYYKKVLVTRAVTPRVRSRKQTMTSLGSENPLDLKREAAYNLAQIYKSTGAVSLARMYLCNYIRV